VTHHAVDEKAYAGSSRNAIKRVLRSFDAARTVDFFRELGVELKREETGKLFPVTDSARTVLTALLTAVADAGVTLRHPWRVDRIEREPATGRFIIHEAASSTSVEPLRRIVAARVILATGGRSLPKSGSDGHGYTIARSLGHSTTERIFPSLVPLIVHERHFVRELSGITVQATLEVRSATGKRLVVFTNSTLCTHFGLSGPAVLDISRYYLEAAPDGASLVMNWLPGQNFESVDSSLQKLGKRTIRGFLREHLPERLADALLAQADITPETTGASLMKDARRALAHMLVEMPLPITGDRGYTYAEVTAGGVPLAELHLDSMESRITPGLHLIGEICDVDGRIGGFNFQWAWASGYLAGKAAAEDLAGR